MANNVGVQVQRATAGPLSFGPDSGDSFLIALVADRGPSNIPTLITSMTRFEQVFGGPTTFTSSDTHYSEGYEVLSAFFNKGGKRAWVTRIVGSTQPAAAATIMLPDRETPTPQDTLLVTAKGEGSWANSFNVVASAGTKTDTFKLEVVDATDSANLVTVETWDNLTLASSPIQKVNDGSDYIQLTVQTLATQPTPATDAYPDIGTGSLTYNLGTDNNGNGSANTAPTPGVDDNNPTDGDVKGTVTSASAGTMQSKSGLKAFTDSRFGRGFIVAPGLEAIGGSHTALDELVANGQTYYRIVLTASQEGDSAYDANTHRAYLDAYNSGFYYPRPKVVDALTQNVKTISPVGHVVADWLKAVAAKGPAKAPAGRDFKIDFVTGMETGANGAPLIDAGIAETLVGEGINPIYDRDGTGPKVWGARAATADAAWQYLSTAYLYNLIADRVQTALNQLIYDVADTQFFAQVRLGIRAFMIDLHSQGAFDGAIPADGAQPDPTTDAFSVQCDESLLSATDKNNGIVRVSMWFRPALTAETIEVNLAKMNAS